MYKKLMVLAVVLMAMAMGVIPAAADGEGFRDGRLNSWVMDAPVAIYYTSEPMLVLDENGYPRWEDGEMVYKNEVVSLDLWGIVPGTPNVEHVLNIPIEELNAIVTNGEEAVVEGLYGYTLGYSQEETPEAGNWFWVTTPTNATGNVYTFQWKAN